MPHNIFLHSALVQSRKIDMSHAGAKREAILYNAVESAVSLSITVVINLMVMAVFAVGFYGTDAAASVGLSSAGKCVPDLLSAAINVPCPRVLQQSDERRAGTWATSLAARAAPSGRWACLRRGSRPR